MYWAPNGEHIAFVAGSSSGLRLYIDDTTDRDAPEAHLAHGPLWMDWSSDSSHLLVHRGLDHVRLDAPDFDPFVFPTLSDPFGYRVPAWRPNANAFAFLGGEATTGYSLYLTSTDGLAPLVENTPSGAAFAWSPDATQIAVTDPQIVHPIANDLLVFERVSFYSGAGVRKDVQIEDAVVAFYWSPDGSRLAYVTLTADANLYRWNVLDIESGASWPIADFEPSVDQLTLFQFFDQYGRSHRVWSPDSAKITFAGRLPSQGRTAGTSTRQATETTVYVVEVGESPKLYELGAGSLAFWSPR